MNGTAPAPRPWAAGAGLFAGPAAWAGNTLLNYALVGRACASGLPLAPLVSAAMLAVALAGGWLSWRDWHRVRPGRAVLGGAPLHMLAVAGVLASLLFGAVILLQGAAGLVFSGCER